MENATLAVTESQNKQECWQIFKFLARFEPDIPVLESTKHLQIFFGMLSVWDKLKRTHLIAFHNYFQHLIKNYLYQDQKANMNICYHE
jgi:hypothetical protein